MMESREVYKIHYFNYSSASVLALRPNGGIAYFLACCSYEHFYKSHVISLMMDCVVYFIIIRLLPK